MVFWHLQYGRAIHIENLSYHILPYDTYRVSDDFDNYVYECSYSNCLCHEDQTYLFT